MRLRKWTSLGNWAERQKTISAPSARLRKNPDTQAPLRRRVPKSGMQSWYSLAYCARGMAEDCLGDYRSCSRRLVSGLGLEESALSDDGGWTSVFYA